jgi:hypothetical protein
MAKRRVSRSTQEARQHLFDFYTAWSKPDKAREYPAILRGSAENGAPGAARHPSLCPFPHPQLVELCGSSLTPRTIPANQMGRRRSRVVARASWSGWVRGNDRPHNPKVGGSNPPPLPTS